MDCEYCSDKTGVEMKTKQFIHLVQIGLWFLNKGQSTDNRTCVLYFERFECAYPITRS